MTANGPTGRRYTPLEMLARLVAFDTVSSKSKISLIDFVEAYLTGWGVPSVRFPNARGDKVALFATVGPRDRGEGSAVRSYRRRTGYRPAPGAAIPSRCMSRTVAPVAAAPST